MDTRRLLIAALLSLAIMVAWGYLFPPPDAPQPRQIGSTDAEITEQESPPPAPPPEATPETRPEPVAESEDATPTDLQPTAGEVEEQIVALSEERPILSGDSFRAEFTNRGGQLVSFQLFDHRSADGGPVDLVRQRARSPYLFGLATPDGAGLPLNDALFTVARETADLGAETLVFRYRGPLGDAEKRFTLQPNGLLEVEVSSTRGTGWAVAVGPGVRNPTAAELENRFSRRSAVVRLGEDKETFDPARTKAPQSISAVGLRWAALQDTYFLTAAVPRQGLGSVIVQPVVVVPSGVDEGSSFEPFRSDEELDETERELEREIALFLVPQGESIEFAAFLGAKEYDRLAALPYGLEETIQLGWFKFLSLPLLYGLRWIHDNIVANYGWAIILMTILIRVLLFPLTHKSTVSMQKMQEINPKVQAIRQKYRSKLKDKQGRPNSEMQRKMNEETMALYKAEGVNPAGGCLPMLLQIPVLFAFYNLLSSAIEIRHAPWILWITDLSAKDPYFVLPVVMGATQFLQQKMTPAAGDPMQRRIFALMPIFFTILFLGFPSGLVLYWLTNNVLGIAQQYGYKRLKEAKAEKEAPLADKKSKKKEKRGSAV